MFLVVTDNTGALMVSAPFVAENCNQFYLSRVNHWFALLDKQDDVFKLLKAKDNETWETYILVSCYPVLKKAPLLFQAVKTIIYYSSSSYP